MSAKEAAGKKGNIGVLYRGTYTHALMFQSTYMKAAERKARKETKLARIEAAEKTAINAYNEAARVEMEKKRDQADAIAAYIEASKTKDELRSLIKKLKKEVRAAENAVMRRRVKKEKLAAEKELARMKLQVVAGAFEQARRDKEDQHSGRKQHRATSLLDRYPKGHAVAQRARLDHRAYNDRSEYSSGSSTFDDDYRRYGSKYYQR